MIIYNPLGHPAGVTFGDMVVPIDERNRHFLEWQALNAQQAEPEDYQTPIVIDNTPPDSVHFDLPVIAPDFIVQTPPINPDPELALTEAIAEMEKGQGAEKSIALVALSLAKYLKSKQAKLK